jgi:hypothetical protein
MADAQTDYLEEKQHYTYADYLEWEGPQRYEVLYTVVQSDLLVVCDKGKLAKGSVNSAPVRILPGMEIALESLWAAAGVPPSDS